MRDYEKREILRSISGGIREARDNPIDTTPFIIAGVFFAVIIISYVIYSNRRALQNWLTIVKKRMRGELVSTDRFKVIADVSIELPGTTRETFRTVSTNLSAHGMFIKYNPPPPKGEIVRFHLFLKGGNTISGRGEVRWVQESWSPHHPSGVGIKFINISPIEEKEIRLWLKKNKPKKVT